MTVGNSNALGTGTVTFAGGSLNAFYSKVNVANNLSIPNTTATISGTNSLTLSGITTSWRCHADRHQQWRHHRFRQAHRCRRPADRRRRRHQCPGAVRDNQRLLRRHLPHAGNVFVGSSTAFGAGVVSLGGGNLLATGTTTITNSLVLNGTTTLTGNSALIFSGNTTLLVASTLNVNNATTLSGIIGESVSHSLTQAAGVGTLTLSNPVNWFSGGVVMNSATLGVPTGTLVVSSAGALGTANTTGSATLSLTSGNFQVVAPLPYLTT